MVLVIPGAPDYGEAEAAPLGILGWGLAGLALVDLDQFGRITGGLLHGGGQPRGDVRYGAPARRSHLQRAEPRPQPVPALGRA